MNNNNNNKFIKLLLGFFLGLFTFSHQLYHNKSKKKFTNEQTMQNTEEKNSRVKFEEEKIKQIIDEKIKEHLEKLYTNIDIVKSNQDYVSSNQQSAKEKELHIDTELLNLNSKINELESIVMNINTTFIDRMHSIEKCIQINKLKILLDERIIKIVDNYEIEKRLGLEEQFYTATNEKIDNLQSEIKKTNSVIHELEIETKKLILDLNKKKIETFELDSQDDIENTTVRIDKLETAIQRININSVEISINALLNKINDNNEYISRLESKILSIEESTYSFNQNNIDLESNNSKIKALEKGVKVIENDPINKKGISKYDELSFEDLVSIIKSNNIPKVIEFYTTKEDLIESILKFDNGTDINIKFDISMVGDDFELDNKQKLLLSKFEDLSVEKRILKKSLLQEGFLMESFITECNSIFEDEYACALVVEQKNSYTINNEILKERTNNFVT